LKGKGVQDRVVRVILGTDREQVTEQCVMRGGMVGTVRVSS